MLAVHRFVSFVLIIACCHLAIAGENTFDTGPIVAPSAQRLSPTRALLTYIDLNTFAAGYADISGADWSYAAGAVAGTLAIDQCTAQLDATVTVVAGVENTGLLARYIDCTGPVPTYLANTLVLSNPMLTAVSPQAAHMAIAPLDSARFLLGYGNTGSSNRLTLVVGQLGVGVITLGTPIEPGTVINSAAATNLISMVQLDTDTVVLWDGTAQRFRVVTCSGFTPTVGATLNDAGTIYNNTTMLRLSNTQFLLLGHDISFPGGRLVASVCSVSGDVITFNAITQIATGNTRLYDAAELVVGTKAYIVYADPNDSNKGKAVTCDISGTSLALGSPVTFNSGQTLRGLQALGMSATIGAAFYCKDPLLVGTAWLDSTIPVELSAIALE